MIVHKRVPENRDEPRWRKHPAGSAARPAAFDRGNRDDDEKKRPDDYGVAA